MVATGAWWTHTLRTNETKSPWAATPAQSPVTGVSPISLTQLQQRTSPSTTPTPPAHSLIPSSRGVFCPVQYPVPSAAISTELLLYHPSYTCYVVCGFRSTTSPTLWCKGRAVPLCAPIEQPHPRLSSLTPLPQLHYIHKLAPSSLPIRIGKSSKAEAEGIGKALFCNTKAPLTIRNAIYAPNFSQPLISAESLANNYAILMQIDKFLCPALYLCSTRLQSNRYHFSTQRRLPL